MLWVNRKKIDAQKVILFCFLFLFFFVPRAPVVSGFLCFLALGALGLGALRFPLPSPPLVPPPLSFCFLFLFCFLLPPPPFFGLRYVGFPFFLGGGCCPVPVWCPACLPCGVVCRVVPSGGVCSLGFAHLVFVVVLPPPHPAVALVASSCAFLVCFLGDGGCCPVPVRCPACSPCGIVCGAVSFGGVCSLVVVRLVLVLVLPRSPPPPPPGRRLGGLCPFSSRPPRFFLFLFVFRFVFRIPVSRLVVLLPVVWAALWCVCCRAVPRWRARAVLLVG